MKYRIILFCFVLLAIFSCQNKNSDKETKSIPYSDIIASLPEQSTYEIIIDSITAEQLTNSKLFLIVDMPYLLIDSIIFPLFDEDTTKISYYSLPNNICPDDIYYSLSNSFWITQDSMIMQIKKENSIKDSLGIPLQKMKITELGKGNICIFGHNKHNDKDELYNLNISNGEATKLLSEDGKINDVIGNGDIIFSAIDSIIYMMNKEEIIPLFNAQAEITSISFGIDGIFYATTNDVGYIDTQMKEHVFINKGAKKLLSFYNTLYILYENGVLCKISNLEFKN